jgi:hypothetical protein
LIRAQNCQLKREKKKQSSLQCAQRFVEVVMSNAHTSTSQFIFTSGDAPCNSLSTFETVETSTEFTVFADTAANLIGDWLLGAESEVCSSPGLFRLRLRLLPKPVLGMVTSAPSRCSSAVLFCRDSATGTATLLGALGKSASSQQFSG